MRYAWFLAGVALAELLDFLFHYSGERAFVGVLTALVLGAVAVFVGRTDVRERTALNERKRTTERHYEVLWSAVRTHAPRSVTRMRSSPSRCAPRGTQPARAAISRLNRSWMRARPCSARCKRLRMLVRRRSPCAREERRSRVDRSCMS